MNCRLQNAFVDYFAVVFLLPPNAASKLDIMGSIPICTGGSGRLGKAATRLSPVPQLVAVVIVLVPVVLGVPAVLVFVPPLVARAPAALARNVQFATLMICLPTVASVVFNGFVQVVFGVPDTPLAPVGVFCMKTRRCGEEENCCKSGG
jgi:hypothetical protein